MNNKVTYLDKNSAARDGYHIGYITKGKKKGYYKIKKWDGKIIKVHPECIKSNCIETSSSIKKEKIL